MKNNEKYIDLRSDTVTMPTKDMIEAIRYAKLGDDVFGEDPKTRELEEIASRMMGKEAALLVASGTQANLISLLAHTKRGDAVILEADSHIYWYEVGGLSAIGGLLPLPIKGHLGVLDPADVKNAIRPMDIHVADTTLICVENTHNRAGGTVTTPTQMKRLSKVAKSYGMKLYMDGARIFNASVALKMEPKALARHVDSLMFCLSKGLGCPLGSMIVGSRELIARARKIRKILGGGMRKTGIIAAPGIIALEKMIDRLEEDHDNARFLAKGLVKIEGITSDLNTVQTNIVNVDVRASGANSSEFISRLKKVGVLALPRDKNTVRFVMHRGIEKIHVSETLDAIRKITNDLGCRKPVSTQTHRKVAIR